MMASLRFGVSCAVLLTFSAGVLPAADEPAPKPRSSVKVKSADPAATKADPYAVPDGTPDEINDFLDNLRRMRKAFATREDAVEHAIKVQRALIAGADKILAQKADEDTAYAAAEMKLQALGLLAQAGIDGAMAEAMKAAQAMQKDRREDIAELAGEWVTELRVIGAPELEPEARTALQTEFLDAVRTTKYSRRSLSNALRLAESLEMHPDSTIAGAYYTELAALMKQSLNDQYIEIAEMLEATARRLKLPGNPMVITGATLAGEPFQWSKYKGKVVLVDFWATWCGPCLQELPNVLANYKKYHAQGFEVVGISVDENKEQLATFLKEQEIPWTTLFAEEGNQPAARYYNVTGIPTAILVGRDGKVLSLMAQGEILNDLLEKEFAKVPPAAVPAKPSPAPTN